MPSLQIDVDIGACYQPQMNTCFNVSILFLVQVIRLGKQHVI